MVPHTNLTNYELTCGAIGSVMGLILWFHLVSVWLVLGAELDAVPWFRHKNTVK